MRKIVLMVLLNLWVGALYAQSLWEPVPFELSYPSSCIWADSAAGVIWIGGNFRYVDSIPVDKVIMFDGQDWDTLPERVPLSQVMCFQRYRGKLHVAGYDGLAIWDGQHWSKFLVDNVIIQMEVIDDMLILLGVFQTIGGDSITSIAAWDGFVFSDPWDSKGLFDGIQERLAYAAVPWEDGLILAGNIGLNGAMDEVIRWNGSQWTPLDHGLGAGSNGFVNDVELYHGDLYAAGYFDESMGAVGNNIARWNGHAWSRLGDGIQTGYVRNLLVHDDKLFVTGGYFEAGGMPATHISYWDGSSWCTFGGYLDNAVWDLVSLNGELYAAGALRSMGGDSVHYMAKWVGGSQTDSCALVPLGLQEPQQDAVAAFPNPCHGSFSLEIPVQLGTCKVGVVDLNGRVVMGERSYRAGDPPVDVSMLPAGVYVVQVRTRLGVENVKLVVN